MSAILCGRCGFPVEDERRDYVLPRCFACLPPPEPLRVIPTRDQLEAEVTRLRAALQAIAGGQPTQHVGDAHRGSMHDDKKSAYYCGVFDGRKNGLHEAAEMAREALVQP